MLTSSVGAERHKHVDEQESMKALFSLWFTETFVALNDTRGSMLTKSTPMLTLKVGPVTLATTRFCARF
jgi:hypothetical protein